MSPRRYRASVFCTLRTGIAKTHRGQVFEETRTVSQDQRPLEAIRTGMAFRQHVLNGYCLHHVYGTLVLIPFKGSVLIMIHFVVGYIMHVASVKSVTAKAVVSFVSCSVNRLHDPRKIDLGQFWAELCEGLQSLDSCPLVHRQTLYVKPSGFIDLSQETVEDWHMAFDKAWILRSWEVVSSERLSICCFLHNFTVSVFFAGHRKAQ